MGKLFYQKDEAILYEGDCLNVLPNLPERSINIIFADPPYNLSCIMFLRLVNGFGNNVGSKISLTGSGEVHNPLGSLQLPRQFDCLPALQWPD